MKIMEIRAKKIENAVPGITSCIAEAEVLNDAGETVFVTVHEFEETEYSVARKSVLAFFAEETDDPADLISETTSELEAARGSYGEVFRGLVRVLKVLG